MIRVIATVDSVGLAEAVALARALNPMTSDTITLAEWVWAAVILGRLDVAVGDAAASGLAVGDALASGLSISESTR